MRLKYAVNMYFVVLVVISAPQWAGAEDLFPQEKKPFVIGLASPFSVYPDPGGYSLQLSKSAEAELRFNADRRLFERPGVNDGMGNDAVVAWRDYIYAKLLTVYSAPRAEGWDYCIRPECPQTVDDTANDQKAVARLVSRETLRFMRQKVPQIQQILESLRLEVADTASKDDPSPVFKNMNGVTELKHVNEGDKQELSVQARMRVRVDEGDISLVSETSATYREASSYFRVNLRKPNNTTFGVKYKLGGNTHLLFERETKYITSLGSAYDDAVRGRISQNALRIVLLF